MVRNAIPAVRTCASMGRRDQSHNEGHYQKEEQPGCIMLKRIPIVAIFKNEFLEILKANKFSRADARPIR